MAANSTRTEEVRALVHDLIVEPDHRDRGIGRALLSAATDEFKRLRAPRLVLSTAARNEAAGRLFERLGFRPTMVEMARELGEAVDLPSTAGRDASDASR